MQIKNAEQLFERQISLLSNVEEQLARALPRWVEAADRKALIKALNGQLEESQAQMQRLEKAVEKLENIRLKQVKDHIFSALIEDTDATVESTEQGTVRDAALIGAIRKIQHYEIVEYDNLRVLAKHLGFSNARDILKETAHEKQFADEKLKNLAKKKINPVAG